MGKVTLSCEYCGSNFEVYPYRAEKAKYCSSRCSGKATRNNSPDVTLTLECDQCGQSFERAKSKSERRDRDFCSHDCYGKWRSENIYGQNHPQWESGKRDYGVGWNENKRRKVRERDNHRCCACGMTQEEHQEELGSVLPVHHIRQARAFDNPEKRNAMDNLITLCRHCHHRWEGIPLKPDTRD